MKYRHEVKYLINYQDYKLICLRLSQVLQQDTHVTDTGSYTVTSLYFDDYFNSAYHEKYAGIFERCKYRIRIYNQSDSVINFERKLKKNRFIHKDTTLLTRQEFDWILAGQYQFLRESSSNLLRIFYYECTSNLLRPRVVVSYEREPYVMAAGTVRISFDKNLRAGLGGWDIFSTTMPALEVLPAGMLIMEVKFTEFLPEILRKILPQQATDYAAVSKYILCCDKTLHNRYSSF